MYIYIYNHIVLYIQYLHTAIYNYSFTEPCDFVVYVADHAAFASRVQKAPVPAPGMTTEVLQELSTLRIWISQIDLQEHQNDL